jgi:hypothetical protein
MQKNFDDMPQINLILQHSWREWPKNFKTFILRNQVIPNADAVNPKQTFTGFRHVISLEQEAAISKERVEQVLEKLTDELKTVEVLATKAMSAASSSPSGGRARDKRERRGAAGGRKKQKQKQVQEQASEDEDDDDGQQADKGKGKRGTARKQSQPGKGKGGARGNPDWLTTAIEDAVKAKCGGNLTFFDARFAWLKEVGFDKAKCFLKDKLQVECKNDRCPVCTD